MSRKTVLTMTLIGEKKVRDALVHKVKAKRAAAIAALDDAAHLAMGKARMRTPYDTGELRKSGKVEGSGLKQILRFGNRLVKYAIPVHERTDVKHPIGQAFFLKSAIDEVARTLASEIAVAMRKA